MRAGGATSGVVRAGGATSALAAAFAVVAALIPPAGAEVPSTFTFIGSGQGHGVGLSQHGARGLALAGATAAEIMRAYFAGADVVAMRDDALIRIGLASGGSDLDATARVVASPDLASGSLRAEGGGRVVEVRAGDEVLLHASGDLVAVTTRDPSVQLLVSTVRLRWTGLTALDLRDPRMLSAPTSLHRYGEVEVVALSGMLRAVLDVPIHDGFLLSSGDMPIGFPDEALRAEAIALRTHALHRVRIGTQPMCACHVAMATDQPRYVGWSREASSGDGRWAAAVGSTRVGPSAGTVVARDGAPVAAYTTPSTGGRTASDLDGLGAAIHEPALRPAEDRGSLTSANPQANWSLTRTQPEVAAAFGLADVAAVDTSRRTAAGAVRRAVATASSGAVASLTGAQMRDRLALWSAFLGATAVRVSGADRVQTSLEVGAIAAPAASRVVVASADQGHLVDGLVAAPLARTLGAPLLLNPSSSLSTVVAADVARRAATQAVLVGGPDALAPGIESSLIAAGVSVRRISGETRFDTAAAVARDVSPRAVEPIVASGEDAHLVDALAAGGPAAAAGRPVLLTSSARLPESTSRALFELGATSTVVVGGPAAVHDDVLAVLPAPRRVAGSDRFATAIAVADALSPPSAPSMGAAVLASGDDAHFADALAASALGEPVVLATRTLPAGTQRWISARRPAVLRVVGGAAALTDGVFDTARSVLDPPARIASAVAGFDEIGFAGQPAGRVPAVAGCAAWADTIGPRSRGMTGRSDFAGLDAMVFEFQSEVDAPFTMQGVPVPLSIAWFDSAGRRVGASDMEPCASGSTTCPLYRAPAPFRWAVEASSGELDRLGLGPGSVLLAGGSC